MSTQLKSGKEQIQIQIPVSLNIDLSLDSHQMEVRGLPKFGNKTDDSDDADVRSDFEEYRGLGKTSIDSFTMNTVQVDDIL